MTGMVTRKTHIDWNTIDPQEVVPIMQVYRTPQRYSMIAHTSRHLHHL